LINARVDYDSGALDRAGQREPTVVLTLASPSAALGEPVTVHLLLHDADEQRGALKPDAQGRSWRGDLPALRRLLEEENRRRKRRRRGMTSAKVGRRRVLIGGVGATAAACGAAAYFWRARQAGGPDVAENAALWQASFPQPEGGPLVMAHLRGSPLVLNFWATWCPPCVKEMPELDRFARAFAAQGVRVVGLAIDNAGPVRQFLQRTPVSYAIGMAVSRARNSLAPWAMTWRAALHGVFRPEWPSHPTQVGRDELR
jgi:thiol-disulfide isomerase/thioredoxin